MRVLVAGGAGYIGSVVTAQLLEAGHEATVLDDLSTGHRDAVPDGARFAQVDLLDAPAVLTRLEAGFDAVMHFAARSLVGESVQEPALYFQHNIGTTVSLIEAMRTVGIERMVFSSTAAVYGQPEAVPITEETPTDATNPYGVSKLAVDRLLAFAAEAYGLSAVSLRYFNVAGAYGRHGERHLTETHLIPRILQVASGSSPHIEIYGTDYPTPDGTAIRDYIHVEDLARAHLQALEFGRPGEWQVYNLGNGEGYSVREVLEAARTVTGHPIPEVTRPRRPGDPARLVASSALAFRNLDWQPAKPKLTTIIGDAWTWQTTYAAASSQPIGRTEPAGGSS
jgi:UDP-glucose 4-epimerase